MKNKKYVITWCELDIDGLFYQRSAICKNKYKAIQLYDKLAQQEETYLIEMEEL